MGEILWAVVRAEKRYVARAPGRVRARDEVRCFCAGGEEQALRLCKIFMEDEQSTPQAMARRESRLELEAPKREYTRRKQPKGRG